MKSHKIEGLRLLGTYFMNVNLILVFLLFAFPAKSYAVSARISTSTAARIEEMARKKCDELSPLAAKHAEKFAQLKKHIEEWLSKAREAKMTENQINTEIKKFITPYEDEQLNYARDFGKKLYKSHQEAYSQLFKEPDVVELIATTIQSVGEVIFTNAIDIGWNNPDASKATYERLLYKTCEPYTYIEFRK
jgi:hypothetical protein